MKTRRLLAGTLIFVMLAGLLPAGVLAAKTEEPLSLDAPAEAGPWTAPVWEDAAAEEPPAAELAADESIVSLVNVASKAAIKYRHNNGTVYDVTHTTWTDSDDRTETNFYGAKLPDSGENAYIEMDLHENHMVKTIQLVGPINMNATHYFTCDVLTKAADDAEWTTRATNVEVKTPRNQNACIVDLASPTAVRYVKFILHQGAGDSWGAIAELKVFAQYNNIAKQALITNSKQTDTSASCSQASFWTDGSDTTETNYYGDALPDNGAYVQMDLGQNKSVSAIQLISPIAGQDAGSRADFYTCDILTKAAGDADWTTHQTNMKLSPVPGGNSATFVFSEPTNVRYIKFDLHQGGSYSWGSIAEVCVFTTSVPIVLPEPEPEDPDHAGLKDIAKEAVITVPSYQNEGRHPDKMVDGDLSSLWIAGSGTWPSDVMFALPGNATVKRIEINFESFDNRSMRVTLKRAFNSVTSNMSTILEPTQHTMSQTLVYTSEQGELMSHLQITLENPITNGQTGEFWPNIAEVKIWAVDETIDLGSGKYADITEHAGEDGAPEVGSNYKLWDFNSNQQIAGFKVTLAEGATAVLKGRLKRDKTWKTYVKELKSGENVLNYVTGMAAVRVELSDPTKLTGFEIWGIYTEPTPPIPGDLAYDKPTHGNFNGGSTYLANDGVTTSGWQADMYPAYLDIDLEANYKLEQIQVYTPTTGYTQYTVYTSLDGQNYSLVADKSKNKTPCTADGDVITLNSADPNADARFVRVYLEYYSGAIKPILNEVIVLGQPSDTPLKEPIPIVIENYEGLAEGTPYVIKDFDDTSYAAAITADDVKAEVLGIIDRQINQKDSSSVDYREWFTLDIQSASNGYDYFTLADEGGRIKVTGNNGVSLATGINHYLKYYCNVHISQVGNQVNMPESIVPIGAGKTVHKETKFPVRYAYNYCTHSYTMSFWNEAEWRNELDWQALNGVNVVLDITGQEEVWREFLLEIGYTHQEAKDFLAGPGYYAWAYMANLTGFGGPIHDSFLVERVELGRKNQRIMRTLGMEPVLQAFSGMVPIDLLEHDPTAEIITQGGWCSFRRPDMLQTDTATYDRYAAAFYAAQKRVFGDARYYATDPFHEGGNTGGMSPVDVSSALLDSLLAADDDAVWIIQSWQGNPTNALLEGLRAGTNPTRTDRRDHALVLDLWAEHSPHNDEQGYLSNGTPCYGPDTDGDGIIEFADTPWVWCMLNNFGGRMGLHGHLDALQQNIPAAANTAQHMAGIGMSPEGAQENPVLYDFLFETIWTDDASQDLPVIDLDQWLKQYVTRRYGADSDSAYQAMRIMADTVYKSSLNMNGQGSPESVINGRPSLEGGKASEWGNGVIGYSKTKLEQAVRLLLADYDTLCASDAYLYDVADVLKQHLSNYAASAHTAMADAFRAGDKEAFATAADHFLALIDEVEKVLGTRSEFTFGKWTGGAETMAENADDFTQRLYLRNAKALVTTWGSKEQNNGLRDYSNRQWSGLTNDYYKARWSMWIDAAKANLAAGSTTAPSFDWFPWEWEYARDHATTYSSTPNGLSLQTLGAEVLEKYSVLEPLGERELDPFSMTLKAGTEESSSEDGRAANLIDRDTGTIWHSNYSSGAAAEDKWVALDLGAVKLIDGIRYLPRQTGGANGIVTACKVFVSADDAVWADPGAESASWTEVGTASWTNDEARTWKEFKFPRSQNARYLKVFVTAGVNSYATGAELRVTSPIPVESVSLDQSAATIYTNAGADHTVTLSATVLPANATNKALNWSSSNNQVASVEGGVVTAVSSGTATITVASQDDPNKTASCTVTVKTRLTGQVLIRVEPVGDPRYGSTLTASLGNITEEAKEHLSYAWYRGETASGTPIGSAASYQINAAADIGQKITLKVTAASTGLFEGSSTVTTEKAVAKAVGEAMQTDPTPVPCTFPDSDDGELTGLHADRKYQYQKQNADGTWPETWLDVPENSTSITRLTCGNYRVRRWFDPATHTAGSFANVAIGSSSVRTYAVNRPNDDNNGNYVRALPRPAEEGATVTVTATAATGWELTGLTITNDDNNATIRYTPVAGTDNEFTFTMPASSVTLAPTFAKKNYTIEYALTHVAVEGAKPATAAHGEAFSFTLAPESEYYTLPVRIQVTDSEGREVAHTYRPHPDDESKKVVGFVAGLDRNITVTAAAEEKTYHIGHNLTNISCDLGDEAAHKAAHKAALDIHLTAAPGYRLPTTIHITVGGYTMLIGAGDYTYSRRTATISIPAGKITGPVEITAAAEEITDPFTLTAEPAHLTGGGEVTFTVTVPQDALEPVLEGLSLENNTSTQLSLVCSDPSVRFTLTKHESVRRAITFTATLPNATRTYTVTAILAENEAANYAEERVTCTVSVSKTGGSSSGSGSSETTKTETKEDGTKVTTVTKPDGTVTETVTAPDGAKTEKVKTPDEAVTITVTDATGEEIAKVEIPATIPESETKFEDLDTVPWAEEAVNNVAALELVKGTGGNKYTPTAPMTRGSLATVLHRLSNGKTDYQATFKDVAQGKYYTEGVAWAAKANVVKGISEDVFAPDDIITREQLAVMLARYAKLIGMDTKADASRLEVFADGDSTGEWAVDGVAWCVENGILKGKGQNNLDPTAEVSRAEVAVMLDRFIELIK